MLVRSLSVLVREHAMFLSALGVILRFFVFAHRVMVLSLVMVMRGGVVVTGRVVMLCRWMFCQLSVLPLCRMRSDRSMDQKAAPRGFRRQGRMR